MKKTLQEALKSKFYLRTWFIGIVFALTRLYLPYFIIGIILTILQYRFFKPYIDKYGKCEHLDETIASLENTYKEQMAKFEQEHKQHTQDLEIALATLQKQIEEANKELLLLQSETLVAHYNFSDYDALSSEDCKNKLTLLKDDEKNLIKSDKAVSIESNSSKKVINDNVKQILRCFNSECDNILMNISGKNIDSMRNKITKSYETLNKIFSVDGISIQKKLLEYKLEELNLVYTAEIKREQERELQKAIKEQMLEEEKVRREIETQKAKIEKDQTQCSKEIDKLMAYMQKSQNDTEKQLYIDKIKELEEKLKELEVSKETVLDREANARAGRVMHIIDNYLGIDENYRIKSVTHKINGCNHTMSCTLENL